jgi:hypothetical protein
MNAGSKTGFAIRIRNTDFARVEILTQPLQKKRAASGAQPA